MKPPGFKVRGITAAILVLGASFVFALLMLLFSDGEGEPNPNTNGYSKSSIGHELLINMLDELGYQVRINRLTDPGSTIAGDLVIYAEPNVGFLPDGEELASVLETAGAVLLVLPKRLGVVDPDDPQKILRSSTSVNAQEVLSRFLMNAEVMPPDESDLEPISLTQNSFEKVPQVASLQLMDAPFLDVLMRTERGVFLGRDGEESGNLFVLSDPDIIATHGLMHGDNAELVVAIIDHILPEGGAIVFDESAHGFAVSKSFWQELFRFPLSLATLHGFLVFLILMWITLGRMGQKRVLPPTIPPGKRFLLENVSNLLTFYGHRGFLGHKYLDNSLRRTANKLRISGSKQEIEARLEVMAEQRNLGWEVERWRSELGANKGITARSAQSVLRVAREVHQWNREMLNGS